MEYVDGESLGQRIERRGAFPEAEAMRLIAQVCEGLQRAHKQGLIHRDVKPDNILVTKDGVAKLTDMGLVKDVEGDLNLTKTGRGLGTPHFMAPEQFRNAKTVDVRGDIYSLGATLYAMVTGTMPFENASPLDCWMKKIRNEFPSPKELAPTLSDRVDWAIRRAMSAEPDRRPVSCREFLEDLTGQSRPNHTRSGAHTALPAAATDVWYMVYKDETGATHTVKGSTEGIRHALQNRMLGDAASILVSRTKTGQFQSLASVPEFRDLVVNPAPLPSPNGARLSGVLSKASGVVPSPTERRRPADADVVDLGKTPSGVISGSGRHRERPANPLSGRHNSTPPDAHKTPLSTTPSQRTPSTPPLPLPPLPQSGVDGQADTELYVPAVTDSQLVEAQGFQVQELPSEPEFGEPASQPDLQARQPFNWTPWLVALILILTAVVCYLLLNR